AGGFQRRVHEFAIAGAERPATFAQPLEAFALVGKRLLHPWQAVDLASHFARARGERVGVGDQEASIDAADFNQERAQRGDGVLAREPAGVVDFQGREIVEMRDPETTRGVSAAAIAAGVGSKCASWLNWPKKPKSLAPGRLPMRNRCPATRCKSSNPRMRR